eukprot:c4240_g1_i1.p1 GENE.c4240_g1_i1~~c4240_g1_i1.p1  ORF type:complete len:591 (-),score=126.87 c4240_g1_i1:151-1923(-)
MGVPRYVSANTTHHAQDHFFGVMLCEATDLQLSVITIQTALDDLISTLVDEDGKSRINSLAVIVDDLRHMIAKPEVPMEGCLGVEEAKSPEMRLLFVKITLRTISRVADQSPFEDVRLGLRKLLSELLKHTDQQFPGANENVLVPNGWLSTGSRRISAISEPSSSVNIAGILRSVFLEYGRINHFDRIMAWHPSYLLHFHTSLNHLLNMPGPLPLPWRSYLCIIAAAQHGCDYIVEFFMRHFLLASGDHEWLTKNGLNVLPAKLAAILELNAILAHQPWLVSLSHMEVLMKGAASWSIAELVHALMLLATFHSLCGFAFGLAVFPDMDSVSSVIKSHTKVAPKPTLTPNANASPAVPGRGCIEGDQNKPWNVYLQETMTNVLERVCELGPEEQTKSMATAIESDTDTDADMQQQTNVSVDDSLSSRFVGKHAMAHVDIDVKTHNLIRSVNWSWDENAYETARHVLPDAALALDAQFAHIQSMTDGSINGVDTPTTAPFRNAVWFYTHRLFGIIHDDYNYQLLNVMLPRKLKHYIKHVACTPRDVNPYQFEDVDVDLQPQERVHVLLLVMEARKQAELLIGLNILMTYKNG